MKVAIIGGTGRIGKLLVQQCLDLDYKVIVPCRNPDGLSEFKHDNLEVVKADVFSAEELTTVLPGVDCVLSCLGQVGFVKPWGECRVYSDGCKSAVAAMEANGITRYCVTSSASSLYNSKTKQPFKHTVIITLLAAPMSKDFKRMDEHLANSTSINYTTYKTTELLDVPTEPSPVTPIMVEGPSYDANDSFKIPRANVAKAMIDGINDENLYKKHMWISMPNN